jgi:hypothetical protein
MLNSFITDLKAWARKPYDDEMNLFDWFLFIGIWVVATILWTRVIRRLAD